MAAVSLFWDTNMAAVTSCENALYAMIEVKLFKHKNIGPLTFILVASLSGQALP